MFEPVKPLHSSLIFVCTSGTLHRSVFLYLGSVLTGIGLVKGEVFKLVKHSSLVQITPREMFVALDTDGIDGTA